MKHNANEALAFASIKAIVEPTMSALNECGGTPLDRAQIALSVIASITANVIASLPEHVRVPSLALVMEQTLLALHVGGHLAGDDLPAGSVH